MLCETIIADQFVAKVVPLIDEATQTIDIIVFDWRWYPSDVGSLCQIFNQSLVSAAKRHVQIRVLTNCEDIVRILNSVGIQAKKLVSKKLLHCKIMTIDNNILITGSHNYTQSAFNMNYEFSLILRDFSQMENVNTFFQTLWLK